MPGELHAGERWRDVISCHCRSRTAGGGSVGGQTLNPDNAIYYTNRALCWLKNGEWDKVIEDCERSVARDPRHVKAHYLMGQALLEKDELKRAIDALDQGASSGPLRGGGDGGD